MQKTILASVLAVATCSALNARADDPYIAHENTTACGLDTGYYVKPTTRVELDFELLEAENTGNADWYILDERSMDGGTAVNTHFFNLYLVKSSGSPAGKFGWSCVAPTSGTSGAYQTTGVSGDTARHLAVIDAKLGKGYFYTDGTLVKEHNFTQVFTSTIPGNTLKLFGRYNFTGASFPKAKIYGFKIYEYTNDTDKVLVHDYAPAVKASVVGLYDSVSGDFLANGCNSSSAIGAFTAGGEVPEVPDDPCIISTGAVRGGMNAGYCYGSDSRIEIDYAFTDTSYYQQRLFGSDNASPRASFYIQGTGKVAFGFDGPEHTNFVAHATDLPVDTFRHTIFIDQPNNKAHFITRGVTNKTVNIASTPVSTRTIPLALFANANGVDGLAQTFQLGGSPSFNYAKVRIYRAKFWRGNRLVRDLVPLVKGGVPGFREQVSGGFVTVDRASHLPNFIASPATPTEPEDGYVSTTGNNYSTSVSPTAIAFDTGYVPNDTTRVELDYALADEYPQDSASWVSNHDWYLFSGIANGYFGVYCNKSSQSWSAGARWKGYTPSLSRRTADDVNIRHTLVLDMLNLSKPSAIVTAGYTNCVASAAGTSLAGLGNLTLKIAGRHDGAGSYAAMKIYGFKIFENGEPVHVFEPYVKNGIAGLRDTVGDKGFISAMIADNALQTVPGGNIAYDADTCDAFVSSSLTNTFSVNTGYYIGPNTRIDADFMFLDKTSRSSPTGTLKYQQFVYECTGGLTSRIYLNGQDGTGAIAWSNSKAGNWTSTGVTMVPGRRYAMSIAGDGTTTTATLWESGVQKYTGSVAVDFSASTNPLRIFSNAAGTSMWAMMRLYSFRIYEYENGQYVLKREFLPYTNGTRTGLIDTVDGGVYWNTVSGSPDFTMTGKGVEGEEKWVKPLPATAVIPVERSVTLTAAAAGAQSYVWTKNGVEIPGETGETLTIPWTPGHYNVADTYACTAIYDVFGVETRGTPAECTVTRTPHAFIMIVR